MGVICPPEHLGVHEAWVKKGSCFLEDSGRTSVIMAQGAANHRRTDSNLAHCPQRVTTCRLTCLPSRLTLAGSYPRVPEFRSMVDEGGRWSRALFIPRLNCALALTLQLFNAQQPHLRAWAQPPVGAALRARCAARRHSGARRRR